MPMPSTYNNAKIPDRIKFTESSRLSLSGNSSSNSSKNFNLKNLTLKGDRFPISKYTK